MASCFFTTPGFKRAPRSLDKKLWLLELEDIEKDSGRLVVRVTASERDSRSTKSEFRVGDVLYGKLRPYLNKVMAADRPGYSTTEIVAIRPYLSLCSHYCALALRRPDFVDYVTRLGQGTKMPRLRTEDAKIAPFPLPPLAEQHRIVAKVDEMLAFCDRLEAARTEREATRDRLAAAALARLNAPDPDRAVFRQHAAAVLDNLTPLTTRRDQIKALRQTILNLAVRGKLVGQDPNDEPASEPLQRIELKRKKLYAAKLIPKPKKLPSLGDMPDVFPLPHGWAWSMLGQLCYRVADGPHFSPQYVPADKGVPLFSTRNVRVDGFDLSSVKYVSRDDHEKFCKRIRPERSDIIYTKGGTTGIAKLNDLDMEFSIWVHLAVLRIEKEWVAPRYLELALNSPHCYEQSQRYTQGISNFDLGLTRMIKITVPVYRTRFLGHTFALRGMA